MTAAGFEVRGRDRSVDVLKGLGIIVVIMGHLDFSQVGGSVISYLYSFNVAIFFVVAGYTYRRREGEGVWAGIVSRFRSLYLPYVVLFAISLLYGHIVVRFVFGEYVIPFELVPTAKALIYSSEWLNTVPTFNFALWFLPIFFLASVAFSLIQRISRPVVYFSVLSIVVASSLLVQMFMPGRPVLSINVLLVAVAFMGFGQLIKRFVPVERLGLATVVALFCLTLVLSYSFPGNVAAIGTYWYYVGGLSSFLILLRISHDIDSSRFLKFVGRNSLLIFGIHGLVANTYAYVGINDYFSRGWDGLILYIINAVYVLLVSVLLVASYRSLKSVVVRERAFRTRLSAADEGSPT